jgi:RNA polymerase sigma-70 factor (ECF subfamily)
MSIELLRQARAGDRDAFAALVDPHRAGLQAHCYRMLGSLQDAEDALQDALLSAWIGLAGFEERASVRTWLYRIVTNRCLNLLRAAGRRPVEAAKPGDVLWLQPYPDVLLDPAPGPEARYESREAISLAFVTAVQLLPPNQRAVLLLRDVLGFRASETADLLGLTGDAVTSALKRARRTLAHDARPAPPAGGEVEQGLVERFVAAFTGGDVDALVALMTDDVWVRMPPLPFEYHGAGAAHRFFASIDAHRRAIARMVPVRANGMPGWGEYARDPATGGLHLTGVIVVTLAGDRIGEITHFTDAVAGSLGLPRSL